MSKQQCKECKALKHDLDGYMQANKEMLNKEWQGLTAEEIASLPLDKYLCQKVERLLKEKNHGTT